MIVDRYRLDWHRHFRHGLRRIAWPRAFAQPTGPGGAAAHCARNQRKNRPGDKGFHGLSSRPETGRFESRKGRSSPESIPGQGHSSTMIIDIPRIAEYGTQLASIAHPRCSPHEATTETSENEPVARTRSQHSVIHRRADRVRLKQIREVVGPERMGVPQRPTHQRRPRPYTVSRRFASPRFHRRAEYKFPTAHQAHPVTISTGGGTSDAHGRAEFSIPGCKTRRGCS
jgi:hypothetical protein